MNAGKYLKIFFGASPAALAAIRGPRFRYSPAWRKAIDGLKQTAQSLSQKSRVANEA